MNRWRIPQRNENNKEPTENSRDENTTKMKKITDLTEDRRQLEKKNQ